MLLGHHPSLLNSITINQIKRAECWEFASRSDLAKKMSGALLAVDLDKASIRVNRKGRMATYGDSDDDHPVGHVD